MLNRREQAMDDGVDDAAILQDDGQISVDEIIKGDTVKDVLQYVQISSDELLRTMRKRVDKAIRDKRITLDESRVLLRFYESGLTGYTYLE